MLRMSTITNGTGNRKITTITVRAERPFIRDSKTRTEFMKAGTRYYDVDGKIFDAEVFDRLMGINNVKGKIRPLNEESHTKKLNRMARDRRGAAGWNKKKPHQE